MPKWLKRQLTQAFKDKDIKQIKFLNKCWFAHAPKTAVVT
ncbi:MAG: hypothetical protein RLZ12_140 [Bacillota bacterium]|jgi:hypothetical protein